MRFFVVLLSLPGIAQGVTCAWGTYTDSANNFPPDSYEMIVEIDGIQSIVPVTDGQAVQDVPLTPGGTVTCRAAVRLVDYPDIQSDWAVASKKYPNAPATPSLNLKLR